MDPWDWVTTGMQVLILIGLLVGARFNSKSFKYNHETFASQLVMITSLQVQVHMLQRILQGAGLVDFGIEDDDKSKVDLVKRDR